MRGGDLDIGRISEGIDGYHACLRIREMQNVAVPIHGTLISAAVYKEKLKQHVRYPVAFSEFIATTST